MTYAAKFFAVAAPVQNSQPRLGQSSSTRWKGVPELTSDRGRRDSGHDCDPDALSWVADNSSHRNNTLETVH
jgi:hypothetical protein